MNAKTPLDQVVVLDIEAGGLDPLQHSILSIGLVTGDGARSRELYVREPHIVTTPGGMAVNRIDLADIEAKGLEPDAACEVLEAFLAPIERPLLAGHNIAFDLAYLRRLYNVAERPMPPRLIHRTIDTHSLIWALRSLGKLPATLVGSDAAFAHFDIAPPPALRHTALGDAIATRHLLERLLECMQ